VLKNKFQIAVGKEENENEQYFTRQNSLLSFAETSYVSNRKVEVVPSSVTLH